MHLNGLSRPSPPHPAGTVQPIYFTNFVREYKHCRRVGHKKGFSRTKGLLIPACFSPIKPKSATDGEGIQVFGLVAAWQLNAAEHRMFVTVNTNNHSARIQLDAVSDMTTWHDISQPSIQLPPKTATSACGGVGVTRTAVVYC